MDWRIQVFKFATLTRVPFGDFLRRLKRRHFGYQPDPDNIRGTLEAFDQMTAALKGVERSFDGATVLEVGSGWFPHDTNQADARGCESRRHDRPEPSHG